MASVQGSIRSKVAIYTRVSTHWQIDKDSLQVQERELTAYCEYVLGIHDYEIFSDPGYSAKNTDRPAYQAMIARIRTGEFSHLLVWKIDRISRNLLDFSSMYKELKDLGVTFVSKNEQFDTSSAIGEAMLKIILVFAELERGMTSERVSSTMLSRATNGQWNGGRIPYGYAYDSSTHEFTLDPKESVVAMRIFDTYESLHSTLQVANALNNANIPTRGGSAWSATTVHKILTNPFYYGAYRYNIRNGTNGPHRDESEWVMVENHHPPMITRQRYDDIQYRLKRMKRGGNQRGHTVIRKHTHVLSDLLQCASCGRMMTSTGGKERADGWRPSNYACGLRRKSSTLCDSSFVSDVVILPFLLQYVKNMFAAKERYGKAPLEKILLSGDALDRVESIGADGLAEFARILDSGVTGLEFKPKTKNEQTSSTERTSLEEQKRKQESALSRLKTLYLYGAGEISESEFIVERKKIMDALSEIDSKLSNLPVAEMDLEDAEQEYERKASYFIIADTLINNRKIDVAEMVKTLSPDILKAFLETILDKVVIRKGLIESIHFRNGMVHTFTYKPEE